MTLCELFAAHLRTPSRGARWLVAALEGAGLELEARAYEAWCAGRAEIDAGATWSHARVTIAPTPPRDGTPGELWFDICELTPMVCTGRSWLATRPMARWQVRGFLDVAPRATREVQVAPNHRALDPARLLVGDERAPVTLLTAGEATLYAWWFGKTLPHLFDWQAAGATLADHALRALWQTSAKEWTSTRIEADEAARIFVTPSTIDWDPDEVLDSELALPEPRRAMIRGELTQDREIGARTAVLVQTGLLERISAYPLIAEDVRLTSLLDRTQWLPRRPAPGFALPPRPFQLDAAAILPGLVLTFDDWHPTVQPDPPDVAITLPTSYLEAGGQDWRSVQDEAHTRWMFARCAELGLDLYPYGYIAGTYHFGLHRADAERLVGAVLAEGGRLGSRAQQTKEK